MYYLVVVTFNVRFDMERPPTLVFSNEDIYIPARPSQPAVHFLDFTDKIDLTKRSLGDDRSESEVVWQVKVGTPPRRRQRSYRIKDLLKNAKQWTNIPPDPDDPWRGMFEGDLVVFSSSSWGDIGGGGGSTGDAGTLISTLYDSVRFVGREHVELRVNEDGESWYDILVDLLSISSSKSTTNVYNTIDFPIKVLEMTNYNAATLKAVYEKLFDTIIANNIPASSSGGVTTFLNGVFLNDIEAYENFWYNAAMAHRHAPQPGVLPMGGDNGGVGYVDKLPWTFSFGDCIWIETVRWDEEENTSSNQGVGGRAIGTTSYGDLGRVSKAELATALEDMGNILSEEFWAKADVDGDGFVTFDELTMFDS